MERDDLSAKHEVVCRLKGAQIENEAKRSEREGPARLSHNPQAITNTKYKNGGDENRR